MINKICHILLRLFTMASVFCSYGQHKMEYQVSGRVYDAENKTVLPGAYVVLNHGALAAITDSLGSFQLKVPSDSADIILEYAGYITVNLNLVFTDDTLLDIGMYSDGNKLDEVVIEGRGIQNALEDVQMSVTSLNMKDARLIPVFFGEVDLLKTLQLKPGIQGGNEGNSGIFVRGGGPDQNLVLMDNAIVYNASHLLGFFSLFNSDAVKSVDLYKGDFPAQFGGRLSSVIDIRMAEGNKEKLQLKGGIGLISSRLSVEGPIRRNKSSFIISARRTYVDIFTPVINRFNKDNPNFDPIPAYYFYDLNAKLAFQLGDKDKVTLGGYFGKDVLDLSTGSFNSLLRWGNMIGSAKWTHTFNKKLYLNTTASFSEYYYTIIYKFSVFSNNLKTRITNYNLKTDFDYYVHPRHTLRFGASATSHFFNIGRLKTSSDGTVSFGEGNKLSAIEGAVYVSDEFELGSRVKANAGMRITSFANDSSMFGGPEPRLSVRYMATRNISIKASFARMFQYVHLASNSGASLPNDIWFPSNSYIKPQRSDQVAAGVSFSLCDGKVLLSNELYYKWMKRQIDIREGAAIFDLPDLNNGFAVGKGWAYGDEIYLEKKNGKLTGWIGYTLSWTWRKFAEINNGERFPARYDRRHNVSVVAIYKISNRLMLSTAWIYATGNAITLPMGRFVMQDMEYLRREYVPQFMARNSFRMPSSHRLDIGLVWKFKPKSGESDLTFSIYNVYNRRNAYFIYFEEIKNGNNPFQGFRAKQVSLFPVLPSITYNFKF